MSVRAIERDDAAGRAPHVSGIPDMALPEFVLGQADRCGTKPA